MKLGGPGHRLPVEIDAGSTTRSLLVELGSLFVNNHLAFEQSSFAMANSGTGFVSDTWLPAMARNWALFGFPTFRITHGLCAELLLTEPGGLSEEPFRPPFPVFQIELPTPESPIVFVDDSTGELVEASHITIGNGLRATDGSAVSVIRVDQPSLAKQSLDGWRKGESIGDLLRPATPSALTKKQDDKAADAAWRLVANFTIYLATLPGDGTARGAVSGLQKQGKSASSVRYIVGREVKLDKRIRALATTRSEFGGTRLPWRSSYRFVVRGHWRNQPVGKDRKERRMTWVRPHWKGPKSAAEAIERRYLAGAPAGEKVGAA